MYFLLVLVIIYSDIYTSYYDAFLNLLIFIVIWPTYLYVSIVLSDRTFHNFRALYVRILSLCSPSALHSLKDQRDVVRQSIKDLVNKFMAEVFPNLKAKEKDRKEFELNESIDDAFGLLSEIGF